GQHAVGDKGRNFLGAGLEQRFGGVDQRAAGIDDVIDQDAGLPGYVADDVHHFGNAGTRAALVDNGEIGAQPLGHGAGAGHAADIGRDDHGVFELVIVEDVAGDDGRGIEVVGRNVEKALDLGGMQIERDDAVDA